MKREAVKPYELMVGNLLDNMGGVEMVTGITPRADGTFFISHGSWSVDNNPLPPDVSYSALPIPLNDEWKVWLGIDLYKGLPETIKYVHQAQNWFACTLAINILETASWNYLPSIPLDENNC